METTQSITAKAATAETIKDMGKDWCPECDFELVESGGHWHHLGFESGEGCTWTD